MILLKDKFKELGFTESLLADDGYTYMEINIDSLEVSVDWDSKGRFDVCIRYDKDSDLFHIKGCDSLDNIYHLLKGLGINKKLF